MCPQMQICADLINQQTNAFWQFGHFPQRLSNLSIFHHQSQWMWQLLVVKLFWHRPQLRTRLCAECGIFYNELETTETVWTICSRSTKQAWTWSSSKKSFINIVSVGVQPSVRTQYSWLGSTGATRPSQLLFVPICFRLTKRKTSGFLCTVRFIWKNVVTSTSLKGCWCWLCCWSAPSLPPISSEWELDIPNGSSLAQPMS